MYIVYIIGIKQIIQTKKHPFQEENYKIKINNQPIVVKFLLTGSNIME